MKFFLTACFYVPAVLPVQDKFKLTAGTTVKLTGGSVITLDNMHPDNDGSISLAAGDGTFRFARNITIHIPGTAALCLMQSKLPKQAGRSLHCNETLGYSPAVGLLQGFLN